MVTGIDESRCLYARGTVRGVLPSGVLLGTVLLAVTPSSGRAAPIAWQATTVPEEVLEYAHALDSLRSPAGEMTVETVFEKGSHATRALEAVLENLSDIDFQTVVDEMTGFLIGREEIVVVVPDPDFFLTLAKTHGEQADILFFEAYVQTVPGGIWYSYIQQQTDYSGCITYGTSDLVDGYRRWTRYREQYPDNYAARAEQLLRDIVSQLSRGQCACGTKDSVLTEFRSFVEAFPRATITPRIRHRIDAIETDESNIRFRCISG